MSGQLNQTWSFVQKNYVADHGIGNIGTSSDGVCLSASCRWAKMVLKSGKSFFGTPKLTSEQRASYFNGKNRPTRIAINQNLFDQARLDGERQLQGIRNDIGNLRAQLSQNTISFDEYEALSHPLVSQSKTISDLISKSSINDILQANKLSATETQMCQSFSEFFLNATDSSCYIFSSNDLNHAFAGYTTGGVFSKDYYFFDPNNGEYIASGDSEIAVTMSRFSHHYTKVIGKQSSKTKRIRVVYLK